MTLPSLVHRRHNDRPATILPRELATDPTETPANSQPRKKKVERGRKNVSRACQTCRQRRIRCTTERPCRPCQSNGIECIGDASPEGLDLRTIRLGPQNSRVFVQQKTLLDNLLQSIRSGTADDALECIKNGGSMAQIARVLSTSGKPHSTSDESRDILIDDEEGPESSTSQRLKVPTQHVNPSSKSLRNFGNLPMSSAVRTNGFSPSIQERQIAHLSKPAWQCSPLISDEASLTDVFSLSCFSFREMARQQIKEGAAPELILSLNGVEMDLLFRDRNSNDPHTVSTWACELLKTFDFLHPVVKMAGAEAVACLMRWLVAPTKEHYMALPPGSVPIQAQFFVPHSIGIDVMMVPEIRDALLVRKNPQLWTDIVTPHTMKFNWAYSIDACLELAPLGQGQTRSCMRLSKAFTEHIHDQRNMSLDREVLRSFPEFRGKFRWHSREMSPTLSAHENIDSLAQTGIETDVVGSSLDVEISGV